MLKTIYPELGLQISPKRIFVPMNVNFNLKNYINKSGESQVYMILTSAGKRKRLPLDVYVSPKNWDKEKQRAKPKTDNHEMINMFIDQSFSKISNIKIHYRLSGTHLTLDRLGEEFKNKTPNYDFIAFIRHHSQNMVLSERTRIKHRSELKKLEEFKKYIPFSEITLEFVNNYRGWLSRTKNNASTTIATSMKFIKKFLRLARKYGVFLNVDIDEIVSGNTNGNRINLTLDEVAKLRSFYESGFIKENQRLALGYFLFSCFTSLRISDLKNLKREDLDGETLTFQIEKTKQLHSIPLIKTAKKILNQNKDLFVRWISEQKINQALKEIAKICGIRKKIHLHVARHSFATNFLRVGGKIEELQVIMAHSKIETTMIYVHIVKSESIKSMYLLDD
ncbi:MAG: site-specific integrase [Flavobacteriaceae bacterium]|jgi:site-specific recombinase XerD|nr:site-specific integrase [Flavobacteriaceae bacterium]